MILYDSRILLVDDEAPLLKMLKNLLGNDGFAFVDTAADCGQALALIEKNEYHLMILDVMLPDSDGFFLFEQIKKRKGNDVCAVFLSARDEDMARLRELGLGADDYITKPFLPEELLLRVKSILRRTYHIDSGNTVDQIGASTVDWSAGTIRVGTESYALTAKEYILLKKLCENRGRIISINTLCDTLWPDGSYGYENSLMVHIRHLREKVEENPSKPAHLLNIRGLGYKLI